MRFTALLVGALATLAAAAETATPSTAAPNTQTAADPAQNTAYEESLRCIKKCDAADVNCQAKCQGLPIPTESQVNATTDCVAACPKGDGSDVEAETKRWGECKDKCIQDNFLSTPAGGSQPTTAAGGATGGDSTKSGATKPTGSSSGDKNGSNQTGGSSSDSGATGTQTGASATPTNGAGVVRVGGAVVGAVAFLAAVGAM